jgi:hypothetical protein
MIKRKAKTQDPLADGMLAYYLSQARAADANVEARLERESFDVFDMLHDKGTARLSVNAARRAARFSSRSGRPSRQSE